MGDYASMEEKVLEAKADAIKVGEAGLDKLAIGLDDCAWYDVNAGCYPAGLWNGFCHHKGLELGGILGQFNAAVAKCNAHDPKAAGSSFSCPGSRPLMAGLETKKQVAKMSCSMPFGNPQHKDMILEGQTLKVKCCAAPIKR